MADKVYGGAADPLRGTYSGVHKIGKGGSDGDMFHGVVRAGPRQGQWHAMKYRIQKDSGQPRDDPQREIDALRAVSHPNIVELLEVFEPHGARRAIVLAFLEADGDLSDFLRRRMGRGLAAAQAESAFRGAER